MKYPARLSFRIEKQIKVADKPKLKEFITTNSTLQEILEALL